MGRVASYRRLMQLNLPELDDVLDEIEFFEHVREVDGRVPPIVVTDGAEYGPVFTRLGITQVVRHHSVRNHIERWMQELKRRIDTCYASFPGHDVETTNNWLRQFAWTWNACLS